MTKKNSNNKNSSKQRRVLIASIILAGVITIGSTFAWFGSKDEVTNKLTATSNYGVSIVESYKPPKNWVPGQIVDKEAGVTNTGNIDAFAKVSLSSYLDIKVNHTGVKMYDRLTSTDEEEFRLRKLKKTLEGYNQELVTLYKADESVSADLPDTEAKSKDEVKSIQAGGRLIYGNISTDDTLSKQSGRGFGVIDYENDTIVGDTFTPKYTGLYIFERAVKATDDDGTTTYTYTYSGYYYVWESEANGGPKYYAINIPEGAIVRGTDVGTDTGHEKVTKVNIMGESGITADNGVSLKRVSLKKNQQLTVLSDENNTKYTNTRFIFYDEKLKKYYLKLAYDNDTKATSDSDVATAQADDIIIRVYLNGDYVNKISNTNETPGHGTYWSLNADDLWTYRTTSGLYGIYVNSNGTTNPTFYLNEILMAGSTSPYLITGVEIDPDVQAGAYVSFDYNLTLSSNSVQVVYESDGETIDVFSSAETDATKKTSIEGVTAQWSIDKATVSAITKKADNVAEGTYNPDYYVTWKLEAHDKTNS